MPRTLTSSPSPGFWTQGQGQKPGQGTNAVDLGKGVRQLGEAGDIAVHGCHPLSCSRLATTWGEPSA